MTRCLFASDLHGDPKRWEALLTAITREQPEGVFLGGDLLPSGVRQLLSTTADDFVADYLTPELERLRAGLGAAYPRVFLILGNDDGRQGEESLRQGEAAGLWDYVSERAVSWVGSTVYGYACVPPTPFLLKDWERYDLSRYVDPGCVSPEEGIRTVAQPPSEVRYGTIARDLDRLTRDADLDRAIFLFHAPPYDCQLDRAALDRHTYEGVPLDLHVGSVAIRRFIDARQPYLTLHGHVHESTRLTGTFMERFGRTVSLQAAHDGPELCLLRFDLEAPELATRSLLPGLRSEGQPPKEHRRPAPQAP